MWMACCHKSTKCIWYIWRMRSLKHETFRSFVRFFSFFVKNVPHDCVVHAFVFYWNHMVRYCLFLFESLRPGRWNKKKVCDTVRIVFSHRRSFTIKHIARARATTAINASHFSMFNTSEKSRLSGSISILR